MTDGGILKFILEENFSEYQREKCCTGAGVTGGLFGICGEQHRCVCATHFRRAGAQNSREDRHPEEEQRMGETVYEV